MITAAPVLRSGRSWPKGSSGVADGRPAEGHRYNEFGPSGLFDRPRRNGPPPRLSSEQQAKVVEWVEQGPDLERDGVVRWRCVDLQQRIAREFAVQLHERTVGKLLRKLSFRRLSVRPQHPQNEPEAQALFRAGLLIS
jgi:transposase